MFCYLLSQGGSDTADQANRSGCYYGLLNTVNQAAAIQPAVSCQRAAAHLKAHGSSDNNTLPLLKGPAMAIPPQCKIGYKEHCGL